MVTVTSPDRDQAEARMNGAQGVEALQQKRAAAA